MKRRANSPVALDRHIPAPEESGGDVDAGSGLKGDWGSLGLLLVLYTLQGVPMGLADSVSLLLREKHVSYKNQGAYDTQETAVQKSCLAKRAHDANETIIAILPSAGVFSFVSWPFSLKILWAPIVDSVFIRSVGLRRTWLIPVQARNTCQSLRQYDRSQLGSPQGRCGMPSIRRSCKSESC